MWSFLKKLSPWSPKLPDPKPWEPKIKQGLAVGVKVVVPSEPETSDPVKFEVPQATDAPFSPTAIVPVEAYIQSILGEEAHKENEMNLSKILTVLHTAGAVIGPMVALADTFNLPGTQKLDHVVEGVKNVTNTLSSAEVLLEEEWAVLKPAVSSVVGAFADLYHALQGAASTPPAEPPKTAG